ncbi:PREDICTED: uncharacterized protein LOC105312515 [Amphimedon queenslandica]|uniref:Cation-dependent mannose-6-phosphate receptor n=2 Tax=Amphimedon queenslandica TaxID=400682 RepID=A0AAN0IL08_AMPQE|nr:PREDICTED: uncharacterized protein LOC105312515 [Amphimedon queenslandica]|eukprot:XP_011403529.1 PREDICTED: uncharacterized protein LOC105312515 [Amphimedon queenslandica]
MSPIVLLIVCVSVAGVSADSVDCTPDQDNGCRATCDDGTTLDISSLLSYPYKIAVDDNSVGQYFTYSPCSGLDCGALDEITVCLDNQGNCGSTHSSMWAVTKKDPLTFTVEYSCGVGTFCTSSAFTFVQNDDEETKVVYTSQEDGAYQFQVTGKCVGQMNCVNEPSNGHKKKSVIGPAGLVLMILFFAALLIYFIAGALVMKYHKGATGKELIPNYLFWSELPFLVKDGCLFVISPCRKRKGYEAI